MNIFPSKHFVQLLIGTAIACSLAFAPKQIHHAQKISLKKISWLLGTWQNNTSKGIMYETWNQTNKDRFSGKSYTIKNGDTVVLETVALIQKDSLLFYVPTVKNQNEGKPVSFTLVSYTDSSMVFECAEHDFPQIISYSKVSRDSLIAEISGKYKGEHKAVQFPMKRALANY